MQHSYSYISFLCSGSNTENIILLKNSLHLYIRKTALANFYSKETQIVYTLANPGSLLGKCNCFAQTITGCLLLKRDFWSLSQPGRLRILTESIDNTQFSIYF